MTRQVSIAAGPRRPLMSGRGRRGRGERESRHKWTRNSFKEPAAFLKGANKGRSGTL